MTTQPWFLSHRADRRALPLADRHYNRQKIGSPQFVPPGRCLVLLDRDATALWVTSYPFAEYVQHRWAGALVCSLFRRELECQYLASDLIRAACAATHAEWEPPLLGLVTFLDRRKVRPTMVRRQPVYGWTWLRAGFRPDGETKGGLLALRLWRDDFPLAVPASPAAARDYDGDLFSEAVSA